MNDSTIVCLWYGCMLTLGDYRKQVDAFRGSDGLVRFNFDPVTGARVYWDVIEGMTRGHGGAADDRRVRESNGYYNNIKLESYDFG